MHLEEISGLQAFHEAAELDWSKNNVFLMNVPQYYESIKDSYGQVLSDMECEKAKKFRRFTDYKSYVSRKHFLRKLLAVFLNENPKAIQFQLLANKKPGVKGIQFNVSHSADLVAIVLGTRPVGIDIEFVKEDFSYDILLKDCFCAAEQDLIHNAKDPLINFYTLWTRKEALLKACGEGLTDLQLNQVDVTGPEPIYNNIRYQLLSALTDENYVLSIALCFSSEKIYHWNV